MAIIRGDNGDNYLVGTVANDIIIGEGGNDTLIGLAGDDILNGREGADRMEGGSGDDTYLVDNAGDTVIESSGQGIDLVRSAVSFALGENVENLELIGTRGISGKGNAQDNVMTGNSANNVFDAFGGNDIVYGNDGNDVIRGGHGDDKLYGGEGDDTLAGGDGTFTTDAFGNDLLAGGRGNDTYGITNAGDRIVELAGEGTDTVVSTIAYTLGAHLENLRLGSGNLTGTGNELANRLVGGAGNNTLNGLAGDDVLEGGAGNDALYGDHGGGWFGWGATRSNDVLIGGTGNDKLHGGGGTDKFVFSGIDNGNDKIEDFSRAEGDKLVFLTDNIEDSAFLGYGQFTGSGGTEVRLSAWNALVFDSTLEVDANGDGLRDYTLTVHYKDFMGSVFQMNQNDFQFVSSDIDLLA